LPLGTGPVGMQTRMPPVRVEDAGFVAGDRAGGGAGPGWLPIGTGPVGRRTRMPLVRVDGFGAVPLPA
jgi:hypothetical protein